MRYAFDTNIWRYLLVDKRFATYLSEMDLEPVGLSSVVAAELIISSATARAEIAIDAILSRWKHTLLSPNASDWTNSARALRRVQRRDYHDALGLIRRMNDALIATSCARVGWTVVTANKMDFERLVGALGSRAPRVIYLKAPTRK